MHNFYFADKWLSYFCGRFVQAPQHEISKRDISAIEIPYKDGDILLDNGRWQNVEFEREICFLPYLSEMSAHHLAKAVTEWLTLNRGYQKYKDTYNPGYFTNAYISNIDSIVRELPSLLSTKIKFNRVPWWYSEIGAKPIELEVNKAVNLRNPEKYISLPTIKITNTNTSSSSNAKANLTINGTKYALRVMITLCLTVNQCSIERINLTVHRNLSTTHYRLNFPPEIIRLRLQLSAMPRLALPRIGGVCKCSIPCFINCKTQPTS